MPEGSSAWQQANQATASLHFVFFQVLQSMLRVAGQLRGQNTTAVCLAERKESTVLGRLPVQSAQALVQQLLCMSDV